MKLLTLLTFFISSVAFAFPSKSLDHLDIVELSDLHTDVAFSIHYPGLDGRAYNQKDCLIMTFSKISLSTEKVEHLSEKIHLVDGDGVLFSGTGRRINILGPEVVYLGRRLAIRYYLKDLGTYVTGLGIRSFSPYISIPGTVRSTLGEGVTARLQFFRGCEL